MFRLQRCGIKILTLCVLLYSSLGMSCAKKSPRFDPAMCDLSITTDMGDMAIEYEPKDSGPREYKGVVRRIQLVMPAMRRRYKMLLNVHPHASGKLTLHFIITGDGFVTEPKVIYSDFSAHPSFERDLLLCIGRLRFAPADKEATTVEFRFEFNAAADEM